MINEHDEPSCRSETENEGSTEVAGEQSSANKMLRPYAGADDSMEEMVSEVGSIPSPCKAHKPELLVGDLVWSKIPGHAWWPSMVSYEPNKAVYFQSSGKGKTCFKYHVQFFGDEPQRGWVSDKNMIKFKGRDPFMELPNSVVAKRDKLPHSKQLRAWERALEQAQKALPLNRQQRKLCYVFKYNDDHLSNQKGAKSSSKSPDSPTKKREKQKKLVKLKSRITRRSFCLDQPVGSQIAPLNDDLDIVASEKDDNYDKSNVERPLTLPREAQTNLSKQTDESKNSIAPTAITAAESKSKWRRRGRSAGNLPGFLLNAVHEDESPIKDPISPPNRLSLGNYAHFDGLIPTVDKKEPKLDDSKEVDFPLTKVTNKYGKRGEIVSGKRELEEEDGEYMESPKKIKLEIVARKPPYFEIIPKKILKNKQTQTPERKRKKAVVTKKTAGRKTACVGKTITTKETHASKKFSRKANEAAGTQKACKKKNQKTKEIEKAGGLNLLQSFENASSSTVSGKGKKFSLQNAKSPSKTDITGNQITNSNRGITPNERNTVEADSKCVPGTIDEDVSSSGRENKHSKGRKKKSDQPTSNAFSIENEWQTNETEAEETARNSHNENGELESCSQTTYEKGENRSVRKTGVRRKKRGRKKRALSAKPGAKNNDQLKRKGKALKKQLIVEESGAVFLDKSELTSSTKQQRKDRSKVKFPVRRSTRNLSASRVENEEYVVCKIAQMPEIDDIFDIPVVKSRGRNGINERLKKRLLLELLDDTEAEIPIEVEGDDSNEVGKQKNQASDHSPGRPGRGRKRSMASKRFSKKEDDVQTEDLSPKQSINLPIDDGGLLFEQGISNEKPESLSSCKEQSHCQTLTLYRNAVDDYLQVRSDENLSTCSPAAETEKHAIYQDSFDVAWQESGKEQLKEALPNSLDTAEKDVGLNISFSENTVQKEIGNIERKLMVEHDGEAKQACSISKEGDCVLTENSGTLADGCANLQQGIFSLEQSKVTDNHHEESNDNVTMFEPECLSGVEDADLYLNADDVGLPVSKCNDPHVDINTPCFDAKVGDQAYCKEIESLSQLSKITTLVSDFEKPTHLGTQEIDDFQPVFPSPSLSLGPAFTNSEPYCEKSIENTCPVMSALSTQSTHVEDFANSRQSNPGKLTTSIVGTAAMSLIEVPSSHHLADLSSIYHLPGNTGVLSVGELNRDCFQEAPHSPNKLVMHPGHRFEAASEDKNEVVNDGQQHSQNIGAGLISLEQTENVNVIPESSCNNDHFCESNVGHADGLETVADDVQCGSKQKDFLSDTHSLQACQQESNISNNCNEVSPESGFVEEDNYDLKCENFTSNAAGLLGVPENKYVRAVEDRQEISIKKSPTAYEPASPYKAVKSSPQETPEITLEESTKLYDGNLTHPPSSPVASSPPQMQSPVCHKSPLVSSGDSAKSGEGASFNCSKRQRKRKAMSDFHVGLAFDEILSNRSRTSDTDKSNNSTSKKKRDSMRKIDFEENIVGQPEIDTEIAQEHVKCDTNVEEQKKSRKKSKATDGKKSPGKKKNNISSEQSSNDVDRDRNNSETYTDESSSSCLNRNCEYDGEEPALEAELGRNSDLPLVDEVLVEVKNPPKTKKKQSKSERSSGDGTNKMKTEPGRENAKAVPKSPSKKEKKKSIVNKEKSVKLIEKSSPEKNAECVKGGPMDTISSNSPVNSIINVKDAGNDKKQKRKYSKKEALDKKGSPVKVASDLTGKDGGKISKAEKVVSKKGTKKSPVKNKSKVEKPKRVYRKKKIITEDLGVNETDGKGSIRESSCETSISNEKSKEKNKRGRKRKIGSSPSKEDSQESLVSDSNIMRPPKKRKKKNAKGKQNEHEKDQTDANSQVAGLDTLKVNKKYSRGKKKSKDLVVSNEDASSTGSCKVGEEQRTISSEETIVGNTGEEGTFDESPWNSADGKKQKKGEKLETRSNVSDETSSVSGREGDDVTKNKRDSICVICEQSEGLISCNGVCYGSFHPDCLGLSTVPDTFFCDECLTGNHSCFLCKETGTLRKCSFPTCGKFYHEECAQKTPGCRRENSKLYCSLHSCGTCANDKDNAIVSKKRLLRCVRCPTAYHTSGCLVAGCMQLTSSLMVCDKHFVPHKNKPHHTHYNVSWCFVCSTGGMLVCCDTCPAAFHPGCVEDLDGVPDEGWQCDSCREGKKPLFGDLVWVKYGFWRWWPARICFSDEIPPRIKGLPHDVGEFPVMFFGSRDYCWLHAGRVFPYQEGDKGCKASNKSGTNKIFLKAIREVEEAYKEMKELQDKQMEQRLAKQSKKPPAYKHIKANKYISAIRNIIDPTEFTQCECSPSSDAPCGPGSECLNRMLQIECDKTCRSGEKCQNQRFQKCQQVDCVPLKTARCGWGLKTRHDIKKGDFVIEYVGELIDEASCRKRINDYHDKGISDYYFLVIDKDYIIDAYPKGNASRFMNHCCDPNCDTQKWTVNGEIRVGLFANKDIKAGSELTFNYNLDTLGNEKKACQCGSKNCSGFLGVRPKTQSALALGEKKKKDKAKKKKKSKRDKTKIIRHEDECFACGDGGELIMCDRLSCSKCYHLKCLTLADMPKGKWDCPWHFCDICGKRASYYCSICPNSFCGSHREGEILEISEGVYICDEHTEDEINSEKDRILIVKKTAETNVSEPQPSCSKSSDLEEKS